MRTIAAAYRTAMSGSLAAGRHTFQEAGGFKRSFQNLVKLKSNTSRPMQKGMARKRKKKPDDKKQKKTQWSHLWWRRTLIEN